MSLVQPRNAILALANGKIFPGWRIGASGRAVGEVVFNTAITGYQEILTDPSYSQQLVTLTYPHIGNVGCNDDDMESSRLQVQGLIVRDLVAQASSFRHQRTLSDFLQAANCVAIHGIDTRALTNEIRSQGALSGCITDESIAPEEAIALAQGFPGLSGCELAQSVSTQVAYDWQHGEWTLTGNHAPSIMPKTSARRIAVLDLGVKYSILRALVNRGAQVRVFPAQTTWSQLQTWQPDGVLLSNGPGDPEPCGYAIATVRELLLHQIPVLGICLGYQILALAAGAQTMKLKFGHHGANHPIRNLHDNSVWITSQNHGFAVDDASLPNRIKATHVSLFDGTLQGIAVNDAPAFGMQGHPEAGPGPQDAKGIFDQFLQLVEQYSTQQTI